MNSTSPILIARRSLPCIDPACAVPIVAGQPIVLTDRGWTHAHHQENA